jgi:hypothetical protein
MLWRHPRSSLTGGLCCGAAYTGCAVVLLCLFILRWQQTSASACAGISDTPKVLSSSVLCVLVFQVQAVVPSGYP